MSLNLASRAKFNLKNANILLVETGPMTMDIMVQILSGFGAKDMHRAASAEAAKALISKATFDLVLVDSVLGNDEGYGLVRWIRQDAPEINRYAPVLMVTAHTAMSRVTQARDCGAHFIVAKPLTPTVLLERILWIAKEQRPFVSCDQYNGPDRRFKFDGPPAGSSGRRHDDLSETLGEAQAPNMSQDQIDAMLNSRKVSA